MTSKPAFRMQNVHLNASRDFLSAPDRPDRSVEFEKSQISSEDARHFEIVATREIRTLRNIVANPIIRVLEKRLLDCKLLFPNICIRKSTIDEGSEEASIDYFGITSGFISFLAFLRYGS